MVSKTLMEEVELMASMQANKLTLEEAKKAMAMYANDKEFQKQLDDHYENGLVVDATHDTITSDY